MEPKIPIFMIVSGVASIFFFVFLFCFNMYGRWNRVSLTKCSMALAIILYIFIFAWNLAGAYWVFKEWDDWEGEISETGKTVITTCESGSYLLIFSLSIIYWILMPFSCYGFFKRVKDVIEEV